MKNIATMTLALLLAAVAQGVTAQSVTAQRNADTISGHHARYYTPHWFDRCHAYQMDDVYMYWVEHTDAFYSMCKNIKSEKRFVQAPLPMTDTSFMPRAFLTQDSALQRVSIIGMTALVVTDTNEVGLMASLYRGADTLYKEERMLLYTLDTASGMAVLVDSGRWDTVKPHPIVMPRCAEALATDDYDLYMHCNGYDAYFDRPHVIEGSFYMAGTSNSNNKVEWINPMSGQMMGYRCAGLPLFYFVGIERIAWCSDCGFESYCASVDGPLGDSLWVDTETDGHAMFGPFIPIIDTASYRLAVASSDSAAGAAFGGGIFRSMTEVTIYAEANDGYRFAAWSDGNADNPRTVEVYCDSALTAVFESTSGIGTAEGDPWGVSVTPNPARSEITVAAVRAGNYTVALLDIDGRIVAESAVLGNAVRIDVSRLPAGTYIVAVGSGSRVVRKTIVKQ